MAPAKKKSKTALIVICSVAGLLLIGGALAFVFKDKLFSSEDKADQTTAEAKPADSKSETKSKKSTKKTSRTKKGEAASANAQAPSAEEIIQKVTEQYDSLTSFSASGRTVTDIDMSNVDPKNIPGAQANLPEDYKKTQMSALRKPQHMEGEFSIKLSKPDLYRVEWEQGMGPGGKMKGATWSIGEGDFFLMAAGPQQPKYVKMQNREMALASATGVSGGAANTIPEIFFKGQSSLLRLFQESTRADDETIDGEDCYVLNGTMMGMKMILWINKGTSLIKQKQIALGGEMKMPADSEQKMKDAMKQFGGKMTDKQVSDMMKGMRAMASKMKGTMTETYSNIEINKALDKADFKYEVPAGTKLSKSLF